jgi:hypothetical protein
MLSPSFLYYERWDGYGFHRRSHCDPYPGHHSPRISRALRGDFDDANGTADFHFFPFPIEATCDGECIPRTVTMMRFPQ